MIIISADVPLEVIDMNSLEKLVDPLFVLKISFVFGEIELCADNIVLTRSDGSILLELTGSGADFQIQSTQKLSMTEIRTCQFDVVNQTISKMIDAIKRIFVLLRFLM